MITLQTTQLPARTCLGCLGTRRACAAAIVAVASLLSGCDAKFKTAPAPPVVEAPPVGMTSTPHEDDVIAPLYSADVTEANQGVSARAATAAVGPLDQAAGAPAKGGKAQPAAARGDRAEADDPSDAQDGSDAAGEDDSPAGRKTSMPQRRTASKSLNASKPLKGGVRKALPVAKAAAPLFGKWTIDQERSTAGSIRADAVLFLDDGRMRVWRGGVPEDGRWTWDEDEGVKTGGVDGIPFTLGAFQRSLEDTSVTITRATDAGEVLVVLTPDRLFVAPPPVIVQPQAPPATAPR